MPKHWGYSEQILDLARVCRVKRADIVELSVASPSPLGGCLTNTQPVCNLSVMTCCSLIARTYSWTEGFGRCTRDLNPLWKPSTMFEVRGNSGSRMILAKWFQNPKGYAGSSLTVHNDWPKVGLLEIIYYTHQLRMQLSFSGILGLFVVQELRCLLHGCGFSYSM